jgi:hypothetical protein
MIATGDFNAILTGYEESEADYFCHTREGGYPELFENTGFPYTRE